MAENPRQTDASEATEAKLCAYLEGEVSPHDRAEIELYLKHSPKDRQLLKDLAEARTLMRGLPREKAPPDVAEAFHGQIERSMLLDGSHDVDPALRINHWPQIILAAAMVLLAAGLGVIVYVILPGPVQKYSVAPQTPSPANAPVITTPPAQAAPAGVPAPSSPLADTAKDQGVAHVPAASVAITPPLVATGSVETNDKLAEKAEVAAADRPALNQVDRDRLEKAGFGQPLNNRLCLLVRTDDPPAAAKQLQSYFASNTISYQMLNGNAEGQALRKVVENRVAASEPTTMESVKENSTTAPSATAVDEVKMLTTQPSQQLAMRYMTSAASVNPIFVAKAMTRDDAAKLSSVLSVRQLTQTSELLGVDKEAGGAMMDSMVNSPTSRAALMLMPVTQPTVEPARSAGINVVMPGDRLTVTVAQLVGPGVDKTNTVRVADNGTINLPMIEPVVAAGQPAADLEKQIAAKYRDANLIPDATVTVNPVPATQPIESAETPASQPVDTERLDVVIVIEKNPVSAATQPATMPADK